MPPLKWATVVTGLASFIAIQSVDPSVSVPDADIESIMSVFNVPPTVAWPSIAVVLLTAEMSTPVVQLAPSVNFVEVLSIDGAVTAPLKVTAPMGSANVTPVQFVPPIVSSPAVLVSIESVFTPVEALSIPETVKAPSIVERPVPETLKIPVDARD